MSASFMPYFFTNAVLAYVAASLTCAQLIRSFVTALVYPASSCGWYLYSTENSGDSNSHCHTVIFVGTTCCSVSNIKWETKRDAFIRRKGEDEENASQYKDE